MVKKRAKEFAASDDDDDDNNDRIDFHVSRSLYKIVKGNFATVSTNHASAFPSAFCTPRTSKHARSAQCMSTLLHALCSAASSLDMYPVV